MKNIILLAALLCFFSCKKADNHDTHIYGQLVDADTHEPVGGKPVELSYSGGNGGFGPNFNAYEIGTTYTDDNGNYSFAFDARTDNSGKDRYDIGSAPSSDSSYSGYGRTMLANVINNRDTELNFQCYKLLTVYTLIKPSATATASDYIIGNILDYPYYGGISFLRYGNESGRLDRLEVKANYPTIYRYRIMRNGIVTPERDDTVKFQRNGEIFTLEF